jgi:DNA-binding NarL/FixJ family response regulator
MPGVAMVVINMRAEDAPPATRALDQVASAVQMTREMVLYTETTAEQEFRPLPVEKAARLAAGIPNARFVLLEGSSAHGNLDQLFAAIDDFLGTLSARAGAAAAAAISSRELEVLRLLAAGRSNQQIADELVISLNTVRRHVSSIIDKTGAANRAQAAAYAKDHGLA